MCDLIFFLNIKGDPMVSANDDSSNCKVIVNGRKCHPDDVVVDVGYRTV
jgi:hypothetical protein